MKNFISLVFVTFTILFTLNSCNKEPLCNKICKYGILDSDNCSCDCYSGYYGPNCEYGGATNPDSDPSSNCGLSTDVTTFWSSVASGPYPAGTHYIDDLELYLPDDYLMTGVGMTVNNFEVQRIKVQGRKFTDECTLGSQTSFTQGSSGDFEMQYSVPFGAVITGLGFGISNGNVSRLKVKYKFIQTSSNGNYSLGNEQTWDSGGSPTDLIVNVSNHINVNLIDRAVLSGFGANVYNSEGLAQLESKARVIQN